MRLLPLLLLAALLAVPAQADEAATIEPQALVERLAWGDQALVVLDVRTAAEYAEGHVPGAQNIPHTELTARLAELEAARTRDIVVYCRSGTRAALAEKGYVAPWGCVLKLRRVTGNTYVFPCGKQSILRMFSKRRC